MSSAAVEKLVSLALSHASRLLLLDYDGTLTPLVPDPERADLSLEMCEALDAITARSDSRAAIVSGRSRQFLSRQLGTLELDIAGEHGGVFRHARASEWQYPFGRHDNPSYEQISRALRALARQIPGSTVEEKELSIAWHFRKTELSDAAAATAMEHAVRGLLGPDVVLAGGHRVIEVRRADIVKGRFVEWYLGRTRISAGCLLMAIGDDQTDEEMFAAINARNGVSVKIGSEPSKARFRLDGPDEVLAFLVELVLRAPQERASF
jgi:trehalose 6-phosphate synthase/phosphatase